MDAEIIAIGDELSSGQRLDTNSKWLSQRLGELGVSVVRHTTVGDNIEHNIEALRLAAGRARIILVTGGLGPTLDDLTRQAIADAWDVPLVMDEASLKHIEELFAARDREMPQRNRIQAMFPEGSRVIANPFGSAPGIDFSVPAAESRIFALPGVPAEMKQMWDETVAPAIDRMVGGELAPMQFHAVKAFGIGESDVEVRLPDLIARTRQPTVGITVSRATITMRIAARARSDQEFQEAIAPTVEEINLALGALVFGTGNDELETVVARLLRQRNANVLVVEVGAASPVSDWLAAQAEAGDDFFSGGIALADLQAAAKWLPPSAEIPSFDDKSSATTQLAAGMRDSLQVDYVLLIEGYPRVTEMSNPNRMFDVNLALAFGGEDGESQALSMTKSLGGHPDVIIARIAKMGLDLLRRKLLKISAD